MRSAAAHCTATAGWHANGSGFSALGLGQQLRRSMPAAATSQQTTGISSREGEPGILADAGQHMQQQSKSVKVVLRPGCFLSLPLPCNQLIHGVLCFSNSLVQQVSLSKMQGVVRTSVHHPPRGLTPNSLAGPLLLCWPAVQSKPRRHVL
jgi:hypothetical protein